MSFTSDLGGSKVIDDSNADAYVRQVVDPNEPFEGGFVERDYSKFLMTNPFSRPIIPRSDWDAIINEREERKLTLTDLHAARSIPVLNQGSLPYCWAYGTVGAMMVSYAQQGDHIPQLSATSVAAKIKGYRKQGGWAMEAIEGIERYGVSTFDFWPESSLSSRHDTAEQRENAKLHKVSPMIGYEELPSGNFDALVSALLYGHPATMGLMWWGHLVFGLRPVIIERGSYGVEIMNSWGGRWENGGKAVLREDKATAQEQVLIRNVTPIAA